MKAYQRGIAGNAEQKKKKKKKKRSVLAEIFPMFAGMVGVPAVLVLLDRTAKKQ